MVSSLSFGIFVCGPPLFTKLLRVACGMVCMVCHSQLHSLKEWPDRSNGWGIAERQFVS
jgi:hypothetical protein